jgi:hypothetical protein
MRALRDPYDWLPPTVVEIAREVADTLVFASDWDPRTRRALMVGRETVLEHHGFESDGWLEQLSEDLEQCGPPPNALVWQSPRPYLRHRALGGGGRRP